jgi:hypothetical protein
MEHPFQLNTREQYRGGGTSNPLATAVASACGNILANRSEVFYDL